MGWHHRRAAQAAAAPPHGIEPAGPVSRLVSAPCHYRGLPGRSRTFSPLLGFVKFAEACGARGMRIDDPRRCGQQLAEALSWDGPAIIECVVDEHEPPYPAKVKQDQAMKLMTALREGTPNRRRIALQMVKDLLDETSFDASPAHAVPGAIGRAAAKAASKLQGGTRD